MDFDEFRKNRPNAKFSDYYVEKLVSILADGQPHGALGKTLSQQSHEIDFEDAGRAEFQKYVDWFGITPDHRVVDFGCGSFRVGLHFIRYLKPNRYFGLDLTNDFITPGLEVLGDRLGPDWQAQTGTIAERLSDAIAFQADFVFSSNVAYHVHPDECGTYFDQLNQLAAKPGVILCFDSRLAKETVRFGDRNWAHPVGFHEGMLPDLDLMRTIPPMETVDKLLEERETVRVIYHFERNRL